MNYVLYIIVFLIILVSDDTYLFGTSGSGILIALKYLFWIVLPFLLLSQRSRTITQVLIAFISSLLVSTIVNINSFGFGTIILLLLIVSAFLLCRKFDFNVFTSIFSDIVLVICVYSLIVYLLTVILGIFETSIITNSAGTNIQYAYGCLLFGHYGILVRLSSIFREPGVFMAYINFALLFDLFINKNHTIVFRVIVYTLSILASFSTGGLATFILILISYSIKSRKLIYSAIIGLLLITMAVFVLNNESVYTMFFSKLEDGMDSSSSLGRISSIFIPFNIWISDIKSFLFGCGIKNFDTEYIEMGRKLYNTTINPEGLSTNTIFNSLAIFGVGFASLTIVGLYKFTQFFGKTFILRCLIFLVFAFIFSNENMVYSQLLYILVMYGFLNNSNKSKYYYA